MNTIKINRDAKPGTYYIEDIFDGLKSTKVLKSIFDSNKELDDVFFDTKVVVDTNSHYMHVKNEDATIVIGLDHLKNAEKMILYLDIVHELVHVKQQRKGLDLYDKSYSYVDRPTEIEAYIVAVKEAKRLGMNHKDIMEYLEVEWITSDEHRRLATHVGLKD